MDENAIVILIAVVIDSYGNMVEVVVTAAN